MTVDPAVPTGFSLAQQQRLTQETFVEHLEYAPHMGSTNDRALELVAAGDCRTPTLVLTERQTGGRGRGTNQWWAGAGALTCSLIIDPQQLHVPADQRPQMSLTLGLAICNTIKRYVPAGNVGLKWPNDVHLNGRKVCGILCEVPGHSSTNGPNTSPLMVLGVGLNVNNSSTTAPQELRSQAIAMIDVRQEPLDLAEVTIAVLQNIHAKLDLLASDPAAMLAEWSVFDILRDRRTWLQTSQGEICGISRGIDTEGALLLETGNGLARFISATILNWE